jgi:hypothetical protein
MKRSSVTSLPILVLLLSASAIGCGVQPAPEATPAAASESTALPSDPPQSALPGEVMFAAAETVTIDHKGTYLWKSPVMTVPDALPAELFEYRFNGDVKTSDEHAVVVKDSDTSAHMEFTFTVDEYSGDPVLQIIKAAAAYDGGPK